MHKNNAIQFNGDNANGQKLLNQKDYGYFNDKPFSYFKQNIKDKIDFKKIDKTFEDSIIKPFKNELKLMVNNKSISEEFSEIIYKNYEYIFANHFYDFYVFILKSGINDYKLSSNDSIEISKRIANIYENPYFINDLKNINISLLEKRESVFIL